MKHSTTRNHHHPLRRGRCRPGLFLLLLFGFLLCRSVDAVLDSFFVATSSATAKAKATAAAVAAAAEAEASTVRGGGGQPKQTKQQQQDNNETSTSSTTTEATSATAAAAAAAIYYENPSINIEQELQAHYDPRFRVYTFAPEFLNMDLENFIFYDWSRIGTLCLFGGGIDFGAAAGEDWEKTLSREQMNRIDTIVQTAHYFGTHVDIAVNYRLEYIFDIHYRNRYLKSLINFIQKFDLDGVNIDTEDPINSEDNTLRDAFTRLVSDIRQALDNNIVDRRQQHTYLSMDVAWSPNGIDNRHYNYSQIGNIVDMMFIMAYDMQSQIWDVNKCTARANSPYLRVKHGIEQFLQLPNISPSKLVLGVPWYGYDYPCHKLTTTSNGITKCHLDLVPFRNAPCSDAAGKEIGLSKILTELFPKSPEGVVKFDDHALSPYFIYDTMNGSNNGTDTPYRYHEVRFDCPKSLSMKYLLAKTLGLAGVGFWNIDLLNYSDISAAAVKIRNDMFEALDAFLTKSDGGVKVE